MNYPTNFPEISTERLILRQLSLNDRRDIFKLRSNKEVNRLITRESPKNLNGADAFIQSCLDGFENQNRVFWAIQFKEDNQIIGSIVFDKINSENSYTEIGYELNPDYHQEGIMTEAMKPVLEFGKSTMNLKTIEAYTHQNNTASIALLEKYAFILDADKKDESSEDTNIFRLDIEQAEE